MKGTLAILIISFVHISENVHLKIMQPYNLAYHKFNKHILVLSLHLILSENNDDDDDDNPLLLTMENF